MSQVLGGRFQRLEALPEHWSSRAPSNLPGVGMDIRSDLYSRGLVLWEMVLVARRSGVLRSLDALLLARRGRLQRPHRKLSMSGRA
jgi:hypothetical protein